MTLAHNDRSRRYKATGKGGGGKAGRTNDDWPRSMKVVAKAISDRMKGTEATWATDSHRFPSYQADWVPGLEAMMPGVEVWALENRKTATPWEDLLWNRCYKMEYSGSSQGKKPQWCRGDEHWRHWPDAEAFEDLYEQVLRGAPVRNWKELLEQLP